MSLLTAVAALGFATATYAASSIAQTCPDTNVCYSLNIPDSTASSGSGDIYFQLSAPTSYSWIGLGQGSSMSGANIFVMYTDSSGSNVTVSPRLGTGHVEPQHDTDAQITVLAGSGVSNGMMTANVKCTNCGSWSGGSMDFTASSASWIYAVKSGSALNTDDLSADIEQHDDHNSFSFDSTKAKGGDDTNPFSSGAAAGSATSTSPYCSSTGTATAGTAIIASPSGSGCPSSWPTAWSSGWPTAIPPQYAQYSTCFPSGYSSHWPTSAPYVRRATPTDCIEPGSSSGSGSGSSSGSSSSSGDASYDNGYESFYSHGYGRATAIMTAHGVMASLAFVILFPFGGIAIRLFSFKGLVWFHAAFQISAYVVYIAAFGSGVYMATQSRMLNNAHPIIGILLFILSFLQPILGSLHHHYFKHLQRRTFWSHAHLWLGRIIITLGIINGGLGLNLAQNSHTGEIAYGVIAAIVWVAYVASIVVGERRRRRTARRDNPPAYDKAMRLQEMGGSSDASSGERSPPRHREFYGKYREIGRDGR